MERFETKVNGETAKLSRKQLSALPLLAAAPSIEEGARNAKVAKVTVYRWLKLPAFAAALNEYRRRLEDEAFNILRAKLSDAAKVYGDLLSCTDPSVRRLAAKDVLQLFQKARENEEFEARLGRIEEYLKNRGLR